MMVMQMVVIMTGRHGLHKIQVAAFAAGIVYEIGMVIVVLGVLVTDVLFVAVVVTASSGGQD